MRKLSAIMFIMAGLMMTGCGNEGSSQSSATPLPATVYLTALPEATVKTVQAARAEVHEGEEIIVRGVVGGSKNPFGENRAIMTIIDDTLEKSCASEGDHCPTPWDYCCTPRERLMASIATVRFVDTEGKPLEATIGADGRIKPFSTVVVRGKVATGSTPENLIIDAEQVFVEKI